MATPDRGLRDKALNIINNVGNYGPLDATIDSYKQAADYADDARKYAELALSGVSDLETQIEKVTELSNTVQDLEIKVEASYTKVTSLDVDAVDGSTASAVYDKDTNKIHFTLPKGKDGVDGENGKSAYQSYLDTTTDNPKKTESEWIASLKGKDGSDGKNGVDGKDGTNGTDGRSAYELAVISGYTGTLEDFNNLNTKSLDKNQNLSDLTNVSSARASLDVYSKEEVDADITSLNTSVQTSLSNKAAKGANSDITALSGLTVALSVAQGGTGAKTAADARTNISAAKSGANSDITSLTALSGSLRLGADGINALDAATLGQVATKSDLQKNTPDGSGTDLINLPTGITLTQYLSNGKGVDPRMPPFNYRDSDSLVNRTASVKAALEYCNTNKLSLFLTGFYKISSIEVVGHGDYVILGTGGFIVEGSGTAAFSFKNSRNITIYPGFSINAAEGSSYTYGLKIYGDDTTGTSLINISGVFVGFPFAIGLGDRNYPNALCSEITINNGYTYNCRRVLEAYGAQTVCAVNGYQMIGDSQTVATSEQGGIADAHGAVVHIANSELMSPSSSTSVAFRSFAIVTGKDQSQYPDAYGSFYITNSAIECAGILFLAYNKNSSTSPKAETGALVITSCHGYMPYDSLNIQVADNFKGKVIIDESNSFHRISAKSTSFIIANAGAQPVCYIADTAFDSFFPKGSSKYSGTCINLFKYKRIGKSANLNAQSITGSQNQTTLKFTQIDSSANQDSGIFSANYSTSTGIFTTPVGGLKDVCVSVQLNISSGIAGSNLYVMLNGSIPVAIYSADNRIISGTVQVGNLNEGDTISLVFQNTGATFTAGSSSLDYFAMFASR